jgi:predicted CxxxxCH...CXXCH cytochrome family protein
MNSIAETGTSMNYRVNQNPEKKYFPGILIVLTSVVILLLLSTIVTRTSYADVTTLVPDGVSGAGGWTPSSGPLLSDDLSDVPGGSIAGDLTYATITGALDTFSVFISNDAAYSGATINSVTINVRVYTPNGAGNGGNREYIDFGPTGALSGANTTVDRTAFSNFSYIPPGTFNSTDIDNLIIDVATTNLAGGEEVQVSEVWVVVDYTPLAAANELNSCDSCHTQPPLEDTSRNLTEGAVVGSHANHQTYACTVCHPNNAVLNHRGGLGVNGTEGRIDMLGNIQGGTYSLGSTGFLQDNEDGTGLGICSNVTCHSGIDTPKWGDATGLSCDGCHGAPPATNAHATHYTAKGWGSTDLTGATCIPCHRDNTAGGGGHSDVTDGNIVLEAILTPTGVSPAISCGSTANGCHNGRATPNWNTIGIACVDCHTVGGSNSATVANPVTGLHNITAVTPTPHDETLVGGGCTECHTKASIGGHWDGTASAATPDFTSAQVGITAMTGGTYTDAGGTAVSRGTCATTCHSDGGSWSRQWSSAADSDATAVNDARCAVCHGDYNSDWRAGTSHEQTFGGAASSRGAGHNSGSGACEDCHSYPSVAGNHNTATHRININEPGTGITEGGGRAWCADCHSDDGAPSTNGTHTITQSVFTLLTVDGANDPVGSCTGCHGTGGANYWPDNSTAHVANDQPGEHQAHMQLLSRRVYNESLAQIVTDTGNGTADFKQKALCDYCHKATAQDGTHNNGTANVFPVGNAKSLWNAADGDANYTGGASGTCATVDCHNNKATLAGTYGWYDNNVADCDMCHTVGGAGANPNTGLHNITPTMTGISHNDTLAACETCHSAIPDNFLTQASGHVDGSFTADSGSNNDRYLFTDYIDGTPGTCAGGNVGFGGCHDGGGEAGGWQRKWSLTADDGGTAVCDNCHGGVNGEGTWTFGSNNATGDGHMSHDRNWDGAGALEVIGQHSADTSPNDRCNTCHVYGDAEYGAFGWGGGSLHGNDQIDMNSSLGYSRSGGDAYGCTSNCHVTPGSHLTENSNWTLGVVAGPSLSCTGCHIGAEGANDQTEVGTNSPHSESTTGFTCEQCHFTSHGDQAAAIAIPYDTRTMGTDFTDTAEIHIIAYGGASTEAESCWNCHAAQGAGFNSEFDEGTPDADNSAPGARPEGTLSTGESTNWIGANWQSANFGYKNGAVASVHQTQFNLGTNPTIDTGLSAADVGTISCTSCHDVHQVGRNGYESGAKPWLRGGWTSNPFPEDGAPGRNSSVSTWVEGGAKRGNVPRAGAADGQTNNELGGWQIEQNNAITFNENYATHGGLCQNCHTLAGLEASWVGHQTVSGSTGNTTNNLFTVTPRGGLNDWSKAHMGHDGGVAARSGSWIGGLRNSRTFADGINPQISGSPDTGGVALSGYGGGSVTFVAVDDGSYQNDFHNFPCSKCHDPHASRLPRLMITNCLDVNHNTWDDGINPSSWAPADSPTYSYNSTEIAYSPTAQNCHRYVNSGDARKESGAETGWNTVTPWGEF